jgi:hypothetical protein
VQDRTESFGKVNRTQFRPVFFLSFTPNNKPGFYLSRRDYSATAQHQTCIHFSRLDVSVIKSHAKSFGEWGIYKLSDIAKKTVDGLDPLEPKQTFRL